MNESAHARLDCDKFTNNNRSVCRECYEAIIASAGFFTGEITP